MAAKEFKGSPAEYLYLAIEEYEKTGKYSSAAHKKKHGRLIGDRGWNLLPFRNEDGSWEFNNKRDKAKVNVLGRQMLQEIPPQVKKDIIDTYGPKVFKAFKKWVTSSNTQADLDARLMKVFSGKNTHTGHWKALGSGMKGSIPAAEWDWLWRAPHVGLNQSPEDAIRNMQRGANFEPTSNFLLNAGVPRNWKEAFIYWADPEGLANKKELPNPRVLQRLAERSGSLDDEDLEAELQKQSLGSAALKVAKLGGRTLQRNNPVDLAIRTTTRLAEGDVPGAIGELTSVGRKLNTVRDVAQTVNDLSGGWLGDKTKELLTPDPLTQIQPKSPGYTGGGTGMLYGRGNKSIEREFRVDKVREAAQKEAQLLKQGYNPYQ